MIARQGARSVIGLIVAAILLTGCGRSDREKVQEAIRANRERDHTVVHRVSCKTGGALADQHRWTCALRVDNPANFEPPLTTERCQVTVGSDASEIKTFSCQS